MRRFIIAASTAALGIGLALGSTSAMAATAAPSSSSGCVNSVTYPGYCGTQGFPLEGAGMRVMAVTSHPVYNSVIVIGIQSDSSRQDFLTLPGDGIDNGAGPDKTFEYAPNGRPSGLCVAVKAGTAFSFLRLRTCNNSVWQTFIPEFNGSNYSWQPEVAEGNQVIQDTGDGGAGTVMDIGPFSHADRQATQFVSTV